MNLPQIRLKKTPVLFSCCHAVKILTSLWFMSQQHSYIYKMMKMHTFFFLVLLMHYKLSCFPRQSSCPTTGGPYTRLLVILIRDDCGWLMQSVLKSVNISSWSVVILTHIIAPKIGTHICNHGDTKEMIIMWCIFKP